MMVDYPVRFKDVRDVEAVFRVCCVMHNMLLHYDGLDTIGQYEEDWKTIDHKLGMYQTPPGHGVVVGKTNVVGCCRLQKNNHSVCEQAPWHMMT